MNNRTFVTVVISTLAVLTVLGMVASGFLSKGYLVSAEPFFASLIEGRFDAARRSLFLPPNADAALFSDDKLAALQSALKDSLKEGVTVRFNRSQKVVSTNPSEATPDGTTRVYFDLVAADRYVEVETLINDHSQKFQYVNLSQAARPVPNLLVLWIVGALFLSIPALNLWAMVRIRSNVAKGRIWRYVTVLVFNLPSITYFATGGIHVDPWTNQMMLGFSFNLSGLSQASASIGLPLGALFWVFKMRRSSLRETRDATSSP